METEKNQLNCITKLSDIIREKYKKIKYNKMTSDETAVNVFKPVVEPLQKLIDLTESKEFYNVKDEPKIEPKDLFHVKTEPNLDKSEHSTIEKSFVEDLDIIPEQQSDSSYSIAEYIQLLKNENSKIDTKFGVRKLVKGLSIGNQSFDYNANEIIVGNQVYPITNGLLKLIFLKSPDTNDITENDYAMYTNIILETNAHRNFYKPDGVIRSNDAKFRNIIAKRINYQEGEGLPHLKIHNNNKIDYIHWDDANELVDRLRLLIASQAAGNTSHSNEIVSIIEELREANIIY